MITSVNYIITILLTTTGFLASWAYGSKRILGPWLAVVSCTGWVLYDVAIGRPDLIPSALSSLFVHLRNLIMWTRKTSVRAEPDLDPELLLHTPTRGLMADRFSRELRPAY